MTHFATELQQLGINLRGKTAGQLKTICPKCGEGKRTQDLSVNIDLGTYKCHKPSCAWSGYVRPPKREEKAKTYFKPAFTNNTSLSDKALKWFQSRGISQKTLLRNKITEGVEWMPQANGKANTIQFNYFRDQTLVNTKFRTGDKGFKMVKDAELIFFGLDDVKGKTEIYIVEGEMDKLSMDEAGYENCISVPNGATLSKTATLEYFDNCWEYFLGVEKVVLVTDDDEPGRVLREELARRIGFDRCWIVEYPEGKKDANEVLMMQGGVTELDAMVKKAKQYPIQNVMIANDFKDEILDLYHNGFEDGYISGIAVLDRIFTWFTGQLTTFTGIPSHGKSQMVENIVVRLMVAHGWRWAIFSPEHFPLKYHFSKIASIYTGKPFFGPGKMSQDELIDAVEDISQSIFFIRPKEDDFRVSVILESAKQLVLRYGIKGVVIDPYNKIKHEWGEKNEHQYINEFLNECYNFKQRHDVHFILVAHPKKINKKRDSQVYEVPTLYDIAGSSNFYNQTDNGITIYRDFEANDVVVYVQKVKWSFTGKIDFCTLKYNSLNGRYYEGAELDNRHMKDVFKKTQSTQRVIDHSAPLSEQIDMPL